MRCGMWLMMLGAWVLIGLAPGGGLAVNPNGDYSLAGKYTWKHGSEIVKGTHSGWMRLNLTKFNGRSTASSGGEAKHQLVLNRKVSGKVTSNRIVTGQIVVIDNDRTVYYVVQGAMTFKITVTNRVKYSGQAKAVSGDEKGAVLVITYKGVHQ